MLFRSGLKDRQDSNAGSQRQVNTSPDLKNGQRMYLNRHVSQENTYMAIKEMKRHSASLVIMHMAS